MGEGGKRREWGRKERREEGRNGGERRGGKRREWGRKERREGGGGEEGRDDDETRKQLTACTTHDVADSELPV